MPGSAVAHTTIGGTMKQYKITHQDDTNDAVSFTITAMDQHDAYRKAVKHIATEIYPSLTEAQVEQDSIEIQPA